MKNTIRSQENVVQTIKQYTNTVFKIAMAYTKDKATSDDILQDVFLKYMMDPTEFCDEEHKKAWLIRVTINECKKFYRSIWNARRIPLEDVYPFNDNTDKHSVFYAVMDLPTKYRTVIHLYYYEDLSVKEISDALNMKENTVMSLLYRARKLLKNVLEVEYEYKPI